MHWKRSSLTTHNFPFISISKDYIEGNFKYFQIPETTFQKKSLLQMLCVPYLVLNQAFFLNIDFQIPYETSENRRPYKLYHNFISKTFFRFPNLFQQQNLKPFHWRVLIHSTPRLATNNASLPTFSSTPTGSLTSSPVKNGLLPAILFFYIFNPRRLIPLREKLFCISYQLFYQKLQL